MNSSRNSSSGSDRAVGTCGNFRRPCVAPLVALFAAQVGETPPDAKPLRGFGGAGVLELIEDHRGDTYRAVYTVRFATRIYVLHAFQKKSKRGIATPKRDLELIRERLKWAERLHTGKAKEG
jgi:phage-related protein